MVKYKGLQGIHLAICALYVVFDTGFAQFTGRNSGFSGYGEQASAPYSRSGQGSDRYFERGSNSRYQTGVRGERQYVNSERSNGIQRFRGNNVQQTQHTYNERNYAPVYPTRDRYTSYRSSERRGFDNPVIMNSDRSLGFSQRGGTASDIGRQYTSRDVMDNRFGSRRHVPRDRYRSGIRLGQQRSARRMHSGRSMGYNTGNRRAPTSRYSPARNVQVNPANPSRQYGSFGEQRPLSLRRSDVSSTYGTPSMGGNAAYQYQRPGDRIATRPGFTGESNEAYQQRTSIIRAPAPDRFSSRVYQRRQFSGEPVSSLELPFEPLSVRYQGFRDSKRAGQLNRRSEGVNVNDRIARRSETSRTLQSGIQRERGTRLGRGSLYERGSMQGPGPTQGRTPYSNQIAYGRSQQYPTANRPSQGRFIGDNYIPHLGGSLQSVLGITTLGSVDSVRPVIPLAIQPTSTRNNIPISASPQVVVRNRQPRVYDRIQNYIMLNSDISDQMEAKTKLINDIGRGLTMADRLNTLTGRQYQNNGHTTTLLVPATLNQLTGRTPTNTAQATAILIPAARNRQGNRRFVDDLEDGFSSDISHSEESRIENSLTEILENIIEAHKSEENEFITSPSPVNMVIITRPGRNTQRRARFNIDT